MELIAFIVLAVLAVATALAVVFGRNAVICALALVLNLISIAGFFFLLKAQFIGFIQIIVYAGAILVLILFVLMLLNIGGEKPAQRRGLLQPWLAPLVTAAFAAILLWGMRTLNTGVFGELSPDYGTVKVLGDELFRTYYYPFEALSLMLVVAMIGAVLLAKEETVMVEPQHYLAVSAILFCLGVVGVLLRRGAILILMSIELMLNASNLAFITFARQFNQVEGQIYVFFIITLAAAEAAVGLAIVIAVFRLRESTDVDEMNLLKW